MQRRGIWKNPALSVFWPNPTEQAFVVSVGGVYWRSDSKGDDWTGSLSRASTFSRDEAERFVKRLKSDWEKQGHSAAGVKIKKLTNRQVRRNPDLPAGLQKYASMPGFADACAKYQEIHGCMPTSVTEKQLPLAGNGKQFFVALGHAPAESYVPTKSQERAGSSKRGKIWVHPYDSKPLKIVDASGRLIMTAPGSHKVTDFIRG